MFGSEEFLRRILLLAEGTDEKLRRTTSRRLKAVSAEEVVEAIAKVHGVKAFDYAKFRSTTAGREMAAKMSIRPNAFQKRLSRQDGKR